MATYKAFPIEDAEVIAGGTNGYALSVLFGFPGTDERMAFPMTRALAVKLLMLIIDGLRRDGKGPGERRALHVPGTGEAQTCLEAVKAHLHFGQGSEDRCILELELEDGLSLPVSLPPSMVHGLAEALTLYLHDPAPGAHRM